MWRLGYLVLMILMMPTFGQAAVIINEIAWMGTNVSANDEWIELYNSGSSGADVNGWTLSDGANLQIDLSGTIAAGGYAVLERTDDSSAPGSAFLIYAGALNNAGATLSLRDSAGNLVDQVAGGTDWGNVGGDNDSKDTAQYTTAGWITAAPTPGFANQTLGSVNDTDDENDETVTETDTDTAGTQVPIETTSSKSSANKSAEVKIKEYNLKVTLTAPEIAYVHQPIELEVKESGLPRGWLESLHYYWNLGDMTTYTDKKIVHRYDYPGKYVVQLEAKYVDKEASLRHEITVLPVTFSIGTNTQGDIQVHNNAKYEIDISGYKIGGANALEFPEGTILLPGSTITIPKSRFGTEAVVNLSNQVGSVVASNYKQPPLSVAEGRQENSFSVTAASNEDLVLPSRETFGFSNQTTEVNQEIMTAPEEATTVDSGSSSNLTAAQSSTTNQAAASVIESTIPLPDNKLPWLGLIGVLGLGVLAVYAGRIKNLS